MKKCWLFVLAFGIGVVVGFPVAHGLRFETGKSFALYLAMFGGGFGCAALMIGEDRFAKLMKFIARLL